MINDEKARKKCGAGRPAVNSVNYIHRGRPLRGHVVSVLHAYRRNTPWDGMTSRAQQLSCNRSFSYYTDIEISSVADILLAWSFSIFRYDVSRIAPSRVQDTFKK